MKSNESDLSLMNNKKESIAHQYNRSNKTKKNKCYSSSFFTLIIILKISIIGWILVRFFSSKAFI